MSTETKTEVLSTGISRLAVNSVVVTTVLTALGTALAIVRFWIRRKDGLGADDYVLMVSLIFLQLQMAFNYMIGFLSGSGWEMEDLVTRPERITWIFKLIYFPELSYTIVVTLIKTSILFSYKRIFGHVVFTKYNIYALLALTWAWGVAFFFTIVFQCKPIEKFWKPELPGSCIPIVPFLWGNSISNFIIDWMILLVPAIPIWKLQLPMKQKILVAMSFMFGSLACIASTVRAAATATFDPMDLGIADYNASIWVYIEAPLATISCCLPFLSRLFGIKALHLFERISSRVTKSSSHKQDSSLSQAASSSPFSSGNRNALSSNEMVESQDQSHNASTFFVPVETSFYIEEERRHGSSRPTQTPIVRAHGSEIFHGQPVVEHGYHYSVTSPAERNSNNQAGSSMV